MKRYLFSMVLALTIVNLTAQVLTRSSDSQTVDHSIKLSKVVMHKTVYMPKFDVGKLLAEDEVDKAAGLPFRFGHIFEVNLNMENSGEWVEMADGRVWVLKISSVGAYSINLAYDKFYLPKGSHIYIYNSDKTTLQGPISWEHNTPNGKFATDLIPGSVIILEYFEPYEVKEMGIISISKVVHGYINLFSNTSKGFGSSGSCNIDINCPEGEAWHAESNSVAMILVGDNRICSGALINSACQDFIPYFLTANHCIQNQNVGNWTFRFGYKSPTCGGGDAYSYYSYFGSSLRANAAISDFALLELNQRPTGHTGITYSGWTRNVNGLSSSVGIHHPNGDVMKISIDNNPATSVAWYGGQTNTHWRVNFDAGVVEHGSSGSPLFDQNHLIVGQLHGNQNYNPYLPYCEQPIGEYGRFDVSWNNGLAAWLDPQHTGSMTANIVSIPFISGPTTVCTSNAVFTLNNPPEGCTITWSHTSGLLTYVSGQGTDSYTVQAASSFVSGSGTVSAVITGPCGPSQPIIKTVWVGKPSTPFAISGFPYNGYVFGSDTEYEFRALTGPGMVIDYYNWVIGCGSIVFGHGTDDIIVRTCTAPDYVTMNFDVSIRVGNECGLSDWLWRTGYVVGETGPAYMVYPNPASGEITVALNEKYAGANPEKAHELSINQVRIMDHMGKSLMLKNFYAQELSVRINISALPKGYYIVKINEGESYTILKD